VKWDSNCSGTCHILTSSPLFYLLFYVYVLVGAYASRMSVSGWGGGIEMAACSRMNKVNVHVYEADRRSGGYKRISCFDYRGAHTTVHVLYRGGVHYDALVPC